MSYTLKSTAVLINEDRTGTPEFITALKPSTAAFQILPIATGAVSSTVNVVLKATGQGNMFISPTGQLSGSPSITRSSITIPLTISSTIPVNPGDVLKFSYVVSGTSALNPKVYFSAL